MRTSDRTDAIADRVFAEGQWLAVRLVYSWPTDLDVLHLLTLNQAAGRSRVHAAVQCSMTLPRQVPLWQPSEFVAWHVEKQTRTPERPLVGDAWRVDLS